MIQPKNIKKLLANVPKSAGVYKMYDSDGKIIYIGKAKDLSKRVKQYFQKDYEHSTRTKKLLDVVTDIKWIVVDNELEALILESTLIKEHQPKYNVIMKDDKSYVYIKITKNEDFPRIQIVRKVEKDKAHYIGPKTAAHKIKDTLKILKKLFPFRHCGLDIELIGKKSNGEFEVKISNKVIKYPCLDYFIKRCSAPCIGRIGKDEYLNIIENVERFLEGKMENIYRDLEKQMFDAAKNRQFEKAGKIRDKLKKIEDLMEKQKVSDPNQTDKDIINYCSIRDRAYFNLFQIRDGKLVGQENFTLNAPESEEGSSNYEIMEAFLHQYYEIATNIPKEILIPHEIESTKTTEIFLEKCAGKKIKIIIPKMGDKNKLLEMSLNNARIFADRNKASWQEENENTENAVKKLQELLKIEKTLKRIECYDISHLSGTDTVGSMVVFENGAPKPTMYRKFKMRTVINKPDDFKSMEEVLTRRFNKLAAKLNNEKYKFRKAAKKDWKYIEEHNSLAMKETNREFFMLEREKRVIGFISTKKFNDKIGELNNLWLEKKSRGEKIGYILLKEAIKKINCKRIYVVCRKELKDYYLNFGFEELKHAPEEILRHHKERSKKISNLIILAYDRIKSKEDESFNKIPDLVIIDGGKGQLASATKVFENLKIKNIFYISLAKKMEEIFSPNKKNSIQLEKNNEALKLLQRARDEAHRFAISYNKDLRKKHFS